MHTGQNSIAPENSLPQLGQVRWGSALMLLNAFQSHLSAGNNTTLHRLVRNRLSTASCILLSLCTSNRVLRNTSALNRISEQNTFRSWATASRVNNDFCDAADRGVGQTTAFKLLYNRWHTTGLKVIPIGDCPQRGELGRNTSSRKVSHFSASKMTRSIYSLREIPSLLARYFTKFLA